MKILKIYSFMLLLAVSLLTLTAFQAGNSNSTGGDKKGSVIKFSHEKHAELSACQDCHTTVPTSGSLKDDLFPGHEQCSSCHDVEDSDQCSTCHYDGVFEPIQKPASELIFSHKQHTGDKTECVTCHAGIEKAGYGIEQGAYNPEMETCFTCHNDRKVATNACESCHISTANLIPDDHKVADFIKVHKFNANKLDANCVMCHDESSCMDCHTATNVMTENNTRDNFYMPYIQSTFKDGAKQQKITRVHSLDFRFSHGIDAKGKLSDCQTCHQTETFCAECHNPSTNGDYALNGIVPMTHLKPGFVTIGVGTGGGEHAKLARRDMNNCVACHDVQGADPNCITCHNDADGIKGTNPKTHVASFMKNENGDWHNDLNSVCYTCHTDANARPNGVKTLGFCSYCHK